MSISHLVPQNYTFYHFINITEVKFHNVNHNEDHIRIYLHSAKFFWGNFDRIRSLQTLANATLDNIQ